MEPTTIEGYIEFFHKQPNIRISIMRTKYGYTVSVYTEEDKGYSDYYDNLLDAFKDAYGIWECSCE